ncbi:mannosyltransferase [Trichonephila inaurata madagascariensis]|uniref:Mannosyltransferase n=1 Tax=Trichonephila inaurata madagascariensis TaxID=2747483 RepID=A0A8X6X3T5_9ARAC|nr:mannosyltransferase [Trichonephila inaurata madagascariensis]
MKLSWYHILCVFRIIFTLFPQTGYIHPDEHFQGPEIVYGDIFNFKIHQAWEFTDEKPIRNIVFPYFITGLPSLLANFLGIKYLHGTFLFPYFMLSRSNSAVIFYKTYMPPRYVLGLTESQKDISIHDFAGVDEDNLKDLLNSLILQSKPQYVYAIIPNEMSIPIQNLSIFQTNYKFVARKCLFPHLSTESLPKLSEVINVILSKLSFWQKMTQIKKFLSIHVLIFKRNA